MAVQVGPIMVYGDPGTSTLVITGTGSAPVPAFLTDPTHLYNGRTADQTACQWGGNTQNITNCINIQRTWTSGAIVPSVITLRGLTGVPVGAVVVVTGQRVGDSGFPYALGGNSATGVTIQFADGSIGVVIVCDAGLTAIQGYQVSIFNNVGGSIFITTAASATYVMLIGETLCYQGYIPPQNVQYDWAFGYDGLPVVRQSTNNQQWVLASRPWETLQITLCAANFSQTFGAIGSPTAITYDTLSALLVTGVLCGCIVRTTDTTGALDLWAIHALSIFGIATLVGKPKPLGGDFYEWPVTFAACAPGN